MVKEKVINGQWCERHWAPYRDETPRPNGVYGVTAMMAAFVNLPAFGESVRRKKMLYGVTQAEAAQMTMEDMIRVQGKCVCCILGDECMDEILNTARGLTGLTIEEHRHE